jgi:hypothetical protein
MFLSDAQLNFEENLYYRQYTGCPGRNVPDFGRTFLGLNYIDRTKNTYI